MIDDDVQNIPADVGNTNPKELFDIKDVEGKTELTPEQVMLVTKLKILGERVNNKYNSDVVNQFVTHFLTLQLSKDRGSRKEFVTSFQSKNDEKVGGMLDKFSMNLGK